MKDTPYNYSGFRLDRMKEPRFRHVLLLGTWIVYFSLYFLTENLIPADRCVSMHCAVDDVIPFCEYFAVFYVGWYLYIFATLAYTLFYDVESFKKLDLFIFATQLMAMYCYIVFPSRQDLRPETFTHSNIFTWVMGLIYSFDTSTGVCPSLHVAYSLGVVSVFLKKKNCPIGWKIALTAFAVGVCIAVCFVKQHSFIDVCAAFPVAIAAEIMVYGHDYWLPKFRGENRSPAKG